MQNKPRIGVLFVTSKWFRDVGLQTATSPVTDEINEIGQEIIKRFSEFMEPVYNGVIFSEQEAEKSAQYIIEAQVDGLIVSTLMWCEDQILRAALKKLPRLPMVVCTFFPYKSLPTYISYQEMIKGSGLVGSLQISGFLKRENYCYQSVSGHYRDQDIYKRIKELCTGFFISRKLKEVKCGVLPFRCDQMSTTYVDEFALRKLYGVELKYIQLQRVKEEAQNVTPEEIKCFKNQIEKDGYEIQVDDKNLTEGIKYSIAIQKVVSKENISILAMNDIIEEMHNCFGLRPCLTNPDISSAGVVVTMEADVAAGVCMCILRLFTGESPFYTELFTADLENNALLMGHPGYHDYRNRDPSHPLKIIPDVEYENSDPFTGACTFFKYKSGPVTVVNSVFNGEKLRWTVFEGYSMEGPPKMEGSCHLFCKTDIPVKLICNRAVELGVSQHWIVIHGYLKESIESLCSSINIEFFKIE